MAVTTTKALTSLHGVVPEKSIVELVDSHGIKRIGTVIISRFAVDKVDISLVELNQDQIPFDFFIEVSKKPVYLRQAIIVVGFISSPGHHTEVFAKDCRVTTVETDSSLFRSDYSSERGMSGAAVIVAVENGEDRVVGVHVGTHDDTQPPPKIKGSKTGNHANAASVSDSQSSLAGAIHGHTAYCLICEVARVNDVIEVL